MIVQFRKVSIFPEWIVPWWGPWHFFRHGPLQARHSPFTAWKKRAYVILLAFAWLSPPTQSSYLFVRWTLPYAGTCTRIPQQMIRTCFDTGRSISILPIRISFRKVWIWVVYRLQLNMNSLKSFHYDNIQLHPSWDTLCLNIIPFYRTWRKKWKDVKAQRHYYLFPLKPSRVVYHMV